MAITEFPTTPCHVFSGVSLRRPVAARDLLHRRFCTVRPGYTGHTSQRFPVHERASGRAAPIPTPMITIASGRRLMSLASPPPGPRSGSYHRPNVPSSPYDADASDTINADIPALPTQRASASAWHASKLCCSFSFGVFNSVPQTHHPKNRLLPSFERAASRPAQPARTTSHIQDACVQTHWLVLHIFGVSMLGECTSNDSSTFPVGEFWTWGRRNRTPGDP
ncbi:hypothetical protein QBC46DRAFT_453634 [Diplogelasinospora grovesii]|uniref:Uncharacterized protein n=1 Tax=Diplogelasinospora grovesii TaxID=303347 RepID=A0AAN6RZ53_9PEZI|nr:hypothetical protein QBC46DRAFT_453634 [Diplogelasinospora grovesii]